VEVIFVKIAAFIDFQGTLGGGGIDDIRSLDLFSFSKEAIKKLNEHDVLTIGITNQSHISKGELTWDEYNDKLKSLKDELFLHGNAHFDAVYCCPHVHSDHCKCKKPLTGMVDEACRDFEIDLMKSYVIGDMGKSDMVLAHNIGAKGILVLTGVGKGSLNEYRHTWQNIEPYYVADNLLDAVNQIINDLALYYN
jgi:histidinol-phosphate phosphatase family protein